jgi:hypothetical protein
MYNDLQGVRAFLDKTRGEVAFYRSKSPLPWEAAILDSVEEILVTLDHHFDLGPDSVLERHGFMSQIVGLLRARRIVCEHVVGV